ncbi:MAG TPA: formate dehydrogenase accessory sulfurtransferase FdhD [Phenylobacterium sp.]|nr:formate dehydrogenase accessory sulfurtransferase FdhD [Phenylobacterium sp.]
MLFSVDVSGSSPAPDPGLSQPVPAEKVLAPNLRFRGETAACDRRTVAEETAVALVHDTATSAVMMATPADLEDFALGFSLNERLIEDVRQVRDLEVVSSDDGIEVRVWLTAARSVALAARRRRQAGPTGCGLCGVDSLSEALRSPPRVGEKMRLTAEDIHAALDALPGLQTLGGATRAVHAAGWWTPGEGFSAVREDVGRHNALDKLAGARARGGESAPGVVVLTSRVSVEMVQKAAVMGAEVVVAVSAPTALAIRTAAAAGMTLVAVARQDGFEVFTCPDRLSGGA